MRTLSFCTYCGYREVDQPNQLFACKMCNQSPVWLIGTLQEVVDHLHCLELIVHKPYYNQCKSQTIVAVVNGHHLEFQETGDWPNITQRLTLQFELQGDTVEKYLVEDLPNILYGCPFPPVERLEND